MNTQNTIQNTDDTGSHRVETSIDLARQTLKEGVTLVATYGDKNPVTGQCVNCWDVRFHLEVIFNGRQRRERLLPETALALLRLARPLG